MNKVAARRTRMVRQHAGWAHGEVRPLDIRTGDTVEIIAGKDKGKRGVVERTLIETQRIVVRGINTMKRHTKAGVKGNMQGGVVDFNAALAYSNAMLVCSRCDQPTRVAHVVGDDGTRTIVCKKCGERHERTVTA